MLLNTAQELFPKQVMVSDYVLGMFGAVEQQGGFSFGNTIKKMYGLPGATIFGSFQNGNAQVEFQVEAQQIAVPIPKSYFTQRFADNANRNYGVIMALTAIHEIMHLAGFTDYQLAFTVATLNKDKAYLDIIKSKSVTQQSRYWDDALLNACRPKTQSKPTALKTKR